jgi:hypothetical protein
MFARLLLTSLLATVLLAAPAWAVQPLTPEQKSTFWGSPEDPPAKTLFGVSDEFVGRHYTTGDEWHAELWQPYIKDLGGGYMGVGSDQAYLYIGWARPEFAWLTDYDPLVVDLHAVYRAFFLEAETPEAFVKFFAPGQQTTALDRLEHHYAGNAKLKTYKEIYNRNRGNIHYRLTLLGKSMRKAKMPCWLTDPETYAYVRDLVRAERVRPLVADLLAGKGVQGVAAAARKLGVTLRVVYLSNAEEYWPYSQQFRANMTSLPVDEKSRILRTLSSFSKNKDYRYNVQPALLYQAWLQRPTLRGVRQMVKRRPLEGPDDVELSVTETDPAAIEAKKKKKPRK